MRRVVASDAPRPLPLGRLAVGVVRARQRELIDYAKATRERGHLQSIALVHGDLPAQNILRAKLGAEGFAKVDVPAPGDRVTV